MKDSPDNSYENSEWSHRLRDGDRAAFEALFRMYYRDLCAFAWHIVRDRAAAEELVQDLFVRIWEQKSSEKLEGSARGYLFAATRNRALNYLKHRRVEQNWESEARRAPQSEVERPDDTLQTAETMVSFEAALAALPEGQRTVFLLSRRHELTYAEIAVVRGVSIKTVETQMGHALKYLRERFLRR